MRNILSVLMSFLTSAALFFQCLFGIGGLKIGKVVLKLEKDTYPVATETIEAELYNCTFKSLSIGSYAYSLERWENDKWTPVLLKESSFPRPPATGLLSPLDHMNESFDLTEHEGITAGKYRVEASGSAFVEFELV